jgi:uncharacterized protein DUF3551
MRRRVQSSPEVLALTASTPSMVVRDHHRRGLLVRKRSTANDVVLIFRERRTQESHMRLAFIGFVIAVAALVADVQSTSAQESFFNERFCTRGGSGEGGSGSPDCSFHTWEQCIASARGLGRFCSENPFWRPNQEPSSTQGKGRRRHS